jgi:hypothetical protein
VSIHLLLYIHILIILLRVVIGAEVSIIDAGDIFFIGNTTLNSHSHVFTPLVTGTAGISLVTDVAAVVTAVDTLTGLDVFSDADGGLASATIVLSLFSDGNADTGRGSRCLLIGLIVGCVCFVFAYTPSINNAPNTFFTLSAGNIRRRRRHCHRHHHQFFFTLTNKLCKRSFISKKKNTHTYTITIN